MPDTLTITPWPDPVLDAVGFDPRSRYVEQFWLPTLGPTALLLLRHLATRFEHHDGPVHLEVAATSQALGLGQRSGTSSPIVRTLARLEQFDLACSDGRGTVAVRRHLPPVQPRHVRRLPGNLRTAHQEWHATDLDGGPHAGARDRARHLALALVEGGDDPDRAERSLASCGFHPQVCHDAVRWAWARHCEAARDHGPVATPVP